MYRQKLKKSETEPVISEYPDYRFHLSENIIYTADKKMLATIVIEGMPFESEKDSTLENALWMSPMTEPTWKSGSTSAMSLMFLTH